MTYKKSFGERERRRNMFFSCLSVPVVDFFLTDNTNVTGDLNPNIGTLYPRVPFGPPAYGGTSHHTPLERILLTDTVLKKREKRERTGSKRVRVERTKIGSVPMV